MPSPSTACTALTTAGEIHAVQAPVSSRESTSPTTNSVANMAATTPIMMGTPVRGEVVSRQSVSEAARRRRLRRGRQAPRLGVPRRGDLHGEAVVGRGEHAVGHQAELVGDGRVALEHGQRRRPAA